MSSSVAGFRIPPCVVLHSEFRPRVRVRVRASRIGRGGSCGVVMNSATLLPSFGRNREKNGGVLSDTASNGGIGEKEVMSSTERLIRSEVEVSKKAKKIDILEELGLLWDDGYGTKTVKDFLDGAKDMIRLDDGPLRWLSPEECGQPLKDSPILLFLPGIDGVGLGLTLHHQALGKVFEVRCLHIPVHDRTPFEGLMKFVEETVRSEHESSPKKPIYLVGESFGACLALAVAARNPNIDLVLILANPATSFNRSRLQTLLPILEALPDGFRDAVPYCLSLAMGNPVKMASTDIDHRLPPGLQAEKLSQNLTSLLDYPFVLADLIPNGGLLWKLKLLKSAASYVNARLHAVKAEVLVIASGNDNLFPSENEARRLNNSLQNCLVRNFRDHGHSILLERGVNLLTIIKGTKKYRRSRRLDHVADYIPPSMSEYRYIFEEYVGWLLAATGSAFYSTLEDGRIVKGIEGVPNEGPVLLVGYHMLVGCEIYAIVEEFLRQKKVLLRGISHPDIFSSTFEELAGHEFTVGDWIKLMGAVPVSGANLFKLFSKKSYILLYPGGQREALHYKGEEYKLFWPDQPEFVRMAARFGATIVPFGTVGEDDIAEIVLDYHDIMKIPILNDFLRDIGNQSTRVRDDSKGEVANQDLTVPAVVPKVPGRFYFLFGKPIRTEGMEEELKDKEKANELYAQIKAQVTNNIEYLLKKREEDPFRNIIDRTLYRMLYSSLDDVPAFDP